MKWKALVVTVVCVMGLAALSVGNADAGAWYACSVKDAGSTYNAYFIVATSTSAQISSPTLFIIYEGNGRAKEMLASALTAVANGGDAQVFFEGTPPITGSAFVLGIAPGATVIP